MQRDITYKNSAHKFNDKNFVSPFLVRRPGSKGSDFVLKRAPNICWLSWASTVTISLLLAIPHDISRELHKNIHTLVVKRKAMM
jgi:hypothetical protein